MGLLGRLFGSDTRVGLYVDGPNVLRSEFDVDLDELRDLAAEEGAVAVSRVYLDEHASPELVQACEGRGFEVLVTSGDVDVKLAVDATSAVVDGAIDVLVVVSRDMDYKPLLETAGRRGVRTVAVAPGEYGTSEALQNAAEEAVTLGE